MEFRWNAANQRHIAIHNVAPEEAEYVESHSNNASQRKQHERAKAKIGRPVFGKGHKVISTSMEIGLLKQADALAKRRKIPRAALIAEGLRLVLSKAG